MEFVVPFRGQNYSWGWFAMVPFAGRIRNGIVRDSKGKKYQLPNHLDPTGTQHALIGFGANTSWEDLGEGSQYLALPEPYRGATATQRFEVLDNALRWSIDYEPNGSDLPVTLGFHPWIARTIGKGGSAEINFQAKKMFKRGDDFLPTGELIDPILLPRDDTFTGIIGTPKIIWSGAAQITLDSDSDYLMIYAQDEEGICFEPVTAPPDAQNLGYKTDHNHIECLFSFHESSQ
jgi:aldose 1-epimerase